MKSVQAAAVEFGDSILMKEGEATYGARQPISLQAAPTKRSRFLIKKIYEQLADTQKSEAREVGLLRVSLCSNCTTNVPTQKLQKNHYLMLCLPREGGKRQEGRERER
jgi:hypothetical protein